jgi:DNA-binding HxlR family transcriptional regulator
MSGRSYDQYCPIAVALDVLGDRWTLLILRELLLGDRRFTDLQRALPGLAPNLLTERLKDLEAEGLVERAELPPPAARTVYRATADAQAVRAILGRLARFGVRRLPDPASGPGLRPAAAVWAMLAPWYDGHALAGQDRWWRLVVDGETVDVAVVAGRLREGKAEASGSPDVTLTTTAAALVRLRRDDLDLRALIDEDEIVVDASESALAELAAALALPLDGPLVSRSSTDRSPGRTPARPSRSPATPARSKGRRR